MIGRLVDAGADVFRLNFSHGTHEEHTAVLDLIRRIGDEKGVTLAVLQDLCGPKIRLGPIPDGVVACDLDADFVLSSEPEQGRDPHRLSSTYQELADDLTVGQSVLFRRRNCRHGCGARGPGWATVEGDFAGSDPLASGYQRARSRIERGGPYRERPAGSRVDQESRRRVRRSLVCAVG